MKDRFHISQFYFETNQVNMRSSYSIYIVSLMIPIISITLLPFINIPIYITSPAIIRPITDVSILRSTVNGRIKQGNVTENQTVKKNDILFILTDEMSEEREKFCRFRIEELKSILFDLESVTTRDKPISFRTNLYKQAWLNYQHKLHLVKTHFEKVSLEYNRNKLLHDQHVISDSEFENHKYAYDKAKDDFESTKQNHLTQWQLDLHTHEEELEKYGSELALIIKEKENLIIKAPADGAIQNLSGVYVGSPISAYQELAQLTPDTALMIEAFIAPNEIGLLKENAQVRFQIDAFNYNQWGLATGKVMEISNDVHIIQDKPVFKVKCSLDKEYLELKNGYKGYLKKGMTMQARFVVTERTLWQLLYDKMDDWLNPNLSIRH